MIPSLFIFWTITYNIIKPGTDLFDQHGTIEYAKDTMNYKVAICVPNSS